MHVVMSVRVYVYMELLYKSSGALHLRPAGMAIHKQLHRSIESVHCQQSLRMIGAWPLLMQPSTSI